MEGQIEKQYAWNDISQIETASKPIHDPGEGKAVLLRHFFFKAFPTPPGQRKPTKAELFGQFKNVIFTNLWADGLKPREDAPIEIHSRRKVKTLSKQLYAKMVEENADFVILCLAEPQRGIMLNEKPQTL